MLTDKNFIEALIRSAFPGYTIKTLAPCMEFIEGNLAAVANTYRIGDVLFNDGHTGVAKSSAAGANWNVDDVAGDGSLIIYQIGSSTSGDWLSFVGWKFVLEAAE